MPDINSPWYPYQKVQESYYDLKNAVEIPRKICDYLIDAPQGDYIPQDNNDHCRVRLWKYLYYDEAKPLSKKLPTIKQKMEVLFNPNKPTDPPNEDKGYRLIPQIYVGQAQTKAQTRLFVYLGRMIPSNDEFKIYISVKFLIWTHYAYELNTKAEAYSRALAIEQALIEALHGVNMTGVGTFFTSRSKHPDCGSNVLFDDNQNVGRELTIALEIATTTPNSIGTTFNMLDFGDGTFGW